MATTAQLRRELRPEASLDDAVTEINCLIDEAQKAENRCDRQRLEAGRKLLALRKRIEAGEAGPGVEWWAWYQKQHFIRYRRDAQKLMAMASAADPEAAHEAEKQSARVRMKRHRAAQAQAADITTAANVRRTSKLRRQSIQPDAVKEVNAFHFELLGFLDSFSARFNAWHDAGPSLDDDGKAALRNAFYLCSDGLARLANKLN